MPNFSTLSLGNRKDADRWRKGMKEKLGFSEEKWVQKVLPTISDYEDVFGANDSWLFIGGHFSRNIQDWGDWPYDGEWRLYDDKDNDYKTPPDSEVLFRKDHVLVRKLVSGAWKEKKLRKGIEFKQECKVIVWGGCSICKDKVQVAAIQALFGAPLIIGWKATTGWPIIDIMLGGYGKKPGPGIWNSPNFWDELGNDHADLKKVRESWLDVASSIQWGGDILQRFCVVDPNGDQHDRDGAALTS